MKNLLNIENLINLILLTSVLFFIFVLNTFPYNKIIYFLFSISAFLMLKYANRKSTFFFEKFFSFFLYFGLWFNFSIKIILSEYVNYLRSDKKKNWFLDGIGNFEFSTASINETLFVCISAFIGIILSILIREKILKIKPAFKIINQRKKLKNFYISNSNIIIFTTLLIIIFFGLVNFNFNIYQRGIVNYSLRGVIYNFFALLYIFLIPTLIAVLLNYELSFRKNNKFLYLIAILEPIITNVSINSRNSIFYSLSYLFGSIKFKILNSKFKNNFFYNFLFLVCLGFVINVFLSTSLSKNRSFTEIKPNNYQYNENLYLTESRKLNFRKNIILASTNNRILEVNQKNNNEDFIDKIFNSYPSILLISRLIGIEGIMSVVGSEKTKNLNLFYESFNEKTNDQTTFYDKIKGLKNSKKCLDYNQNSDFYKKYDINKFCLKNISLVGVVGFLYYSGSYLFVCLLISLISLTLSIFEKLVFHFTKNIIFCCLISQIFAYRLMHFGYMPSDTYKIVIGSVIATISLSLFYKIINKLFR